MTPSRSLAQSTLQHLNVGHGMDNEIVSAAAGATISQGAVDGSEMGVFASQKNPIKDRSVLIKYQEYMPLGLNPVIIHVT